MTNKDDNNVNNEDKRYNDYNGSYHVIIYNYETLKYPLKGSYTYLGVPLKGDLL